MVARKKAAPDFPSDSCGACHYCHAMDDDDVREQQGACYAMPPICIDEGSVRPLVSWSDFPCKYFRLRAHA